jgi:hypothetical protein
MTEQEAQALAEMEAGFEQALARLVDELDDPEFFQEVGLVMTAIQRTLLAAHADQARANADGKQTHAGAVGKLLALSMMQVAMASYRRSLMEDA